MLVCNIRTCLGWLDRGEGLQDLLFSDGMTCWPASRGLPRDGLTEGNACKTPMDLLFTMA